MNFRVFFITFIVSVVLVLIGFTLGNQSIRLDEAQSIWVTTKPLDSVLSVVSRDVHTPLYFIILHFWIKVFGSGVVQVRLLSFLFYIITLPFLYRLVKSISSSKMALMTIALFSISPFILWYSFEARMYSMLVLFTVLSHTYFLRLIETGGRTGKTRFIFLSILGIYTHYFFSFIILSQFVYLLFLKFVVKNPENRENIKSAFRAFIEAGIIIGIFFSPWIYYVVRGGAASNTRPEIPAPGSYNILQAIILFIFGFQSNVTQSLLVALWPLLGIFLFLIFTKGTKLDVRYAGYFVITTFLPILMLYLISFVIPVFLPRYIIFVTPTLFLLLAASLSGGDDNIFKNFSVFFLGMIFLFLIIQTSSSLNTAKEDYRGVVSYLNTEAKPSDIVVASAPFTVYPIEYYYRGKAKLTTIPEWNRNEEGAIPAFDQNAMEKQIEGYTKNYDRLFMILSYDQGYESKIRQDLDQKYQLLGRKKFSDGLELSVYQLRYERELPFLNI